MKKEDLQLILEKEAGRLVRKRIVLMQIAISAPIFFILFFVFEDVFNFLALCVGYLMLSVFFIRFPFFWRAKLTDSLKSAFYDVVNRRAKKCNERINSGAEKIFLETKKLVELQNENEILSEILKNNLKELKDSNLDEIKIIIRPVAENI